MQIKDPKPEIMRLEELAVLVKAGEIKLPRFQRPFVWKEPDMLKLLDSLYKGYPIGSILIWNSSQKLNSERSISGLEVDVEGTTHYPTNYLLDGQQRLTTLCGALFWEGSDENSKWNIHFDLEKEEFIHPKRRDLTTLFPLNRIINTRDFIRQCMKFDHHEKRDEFFRVAERLLKAIKDYKIAVVKIGDMTIEEVAPIFERINSTGRKLTIVDLMMAATWSNGFDLTSAIQSIRSACAKLGFDDIADAIILRSISASAELGVNKDDIQKLRGKKPEELTRAAQEAEVGLSKALLFLSTEAGIKDFGYIPYGMQLTYLAEFFRLNLSPSEAQIDHLKRWFWYTSVTRYFGTSATTGQVAKDINTFRLFAHNKSESLFTAGEIDVSKLLFDKFNLRNATSTTFVLLLNLQNAMETIDGRPIDGSHLKLRSSKFFATFAPRKSELDRLNISKIIYPYPANKLGDINSNQLTTNLLDDRCVEAVEKGVDEEFATARAEIITKLVSKLTGCKATYDFPQQGSIEPEIEDEDD